MTLYAQFDTGEQYPLATTSGWGDAGRWIDGLAEDDFSELAHLREHGWSQNLGEVESQLHTALADDPPADMMVKKTAFGLLHILDAKGDAEVLLVTDGMGPDTEPNPEPKEKAMPVELPEVPSGLIEVPDVRQRDFFSCGAAASMSVGRHLGVGPETLDEWKTALGTTEETSTRPQAIIDYFTSLGMQVEARQNMTIDDLKAAWLSGKPVITPIQEYGVPSKQASMEFGHYVVVIGLWGGYLFVQDPSYDNVLQQEQHPETGGLPEELINYALEFLDLPI